MNLPIKKIRQWLRYFRDYQAKTTARAIDNRKRNNDALFSRLGIKQPVGCIQISKKRIIFHTIVAFGLFAGICYWLTVSYTENGQGLFFGVAFLPPLAMIAYLVAVYFLSKK